MGIVFLRTIYCIFFYIHCVFAHNLLYIYRNCIFAHTLLSFLRELYLCHIQLIFYITCSFTHNLLIFLNRNCIFAHTLLSFLRELYLCAQSTVFFTRVVFLRTIYRHLTGFDMRLVFRALCLCVLLQIFCICSFTRVSSPVRFMNFTPLCYRHTCDTAVIALSNAFQPFLKFSLTGTYMPLAFLLPSALSL